MAVPPHFDQDDNTCDPAQPQHNSHAAAVEVLKRTENAYRKITSFEAKLVIDSKTTFPTNPLLEKRSVSIKYQSPDQFVLFSHDSNQQAMSLVGKATDIRVQAAGRTQHFRSLKEGLFSLSGLTLRGSVVLPGCLLNIRWDDPSMAALCNNQSFIEFWMTDAELDRDIIIAERPHFCIKCESEFATWTLYIDKETHLLTRVVYNVSKDNILALNKAGHSYGRSGTIESAEISQELSDVIINKDTDIKMQND